MPDAAPDTQTALNTAAIDDLRTGQRDLAAAVAAQARQSSENHGTTQGHLGEIRGSVGEIRGRLDTLIEIASKPGPVERMVTAAINAVPKDPKVWLLIGSVLGGGSGVGALLHGCNEPAPVHATTTEIHAEP